jgi:glycine hydroxymethyltransferase
MRCLPMPDLAALLPMPQVQANCRALAARLMQHGHKLVTDGTDNHLILWDLRPYGLSGGKMQVGSLCDG